MNKNYYFVVGMYIFYSRNKFGVNQKYYNLILLVIGYFNLYQNPNIFPRQGAIQSVLFLTHLHK